MPEALAVTNTFLQLSDEHTLDGLRRSDAENGTPWAGW